MYDAAILKRLAKFGELAPAAMEGFLAFDKAAMSEGAIPVKMKELIAVAVAATTQCPYCIDIHSKRAGGEVTHGTYCRT
jgi:alkylhydroperoxidase/carboxymuconolactone decarboxylase family protein YurZ